MNSKITFPELIELVAQATHTSKRMAELFLKELFATVSQALIEGESVRIKNLGTFRVDEVKSRKSVSVNTGQAVEIPSHRRLVFTPAKSLADAINEPFAHFETVVLDDAITDEELDAIDNVVEEPVVAEETSAGDAPVVEETPIVEGPVPVVTPPPFTFGSTESPVEEPAAEEPETIESEPENIQPAALMQITECEEQQDNEPQVKLEEETEVESMPEPEAALEVETPAEPEVEEEPEPVVAPEQIVEPAEVEPATKETEPMMSIVQFEREKREIARCSTLRGAIWGALGMLAVILLGWGIYSVATSPAKPSQEIAQVDEPDEMSTTEQVMREEIAPADTATAVENVAEPVEGPIGQDMFAEDSKPKVVTEVVTNTMVLSRIAKKHYGLREFWVYIYEENKDKIDNPNHITPGTKVVIPPAEKYGIDKDDPESVATARKKQAELFAKYSSKSSKSSSSRRSRR